MRAAVLREYGQPLDIIDRPDPTPAPEGAVVAVVACGICRSDWHAWQGHGEWADDQVPLDYTLGHEAAGRVIAVGDQVDRVCEGDRVTVPFDLGCGTCGRCTNGHGNVCPDGYALGFERSVPGAFAEQVAVPRADYNLAHLPSDVSFDAAAALGCRFATAYNALDARADVRAGDRVAVFGCGGVGLSAVQVTEALGASAIAVDIRERALGRARDAGAVETVNAAETDPTAAIRDLTCGGADVAMDALGNQATAEAAVRALRPQGTHVQVGLTGEEERGKVSLPSDWMTRWELTWVGARGMPPSRYPDLISLVADGTLAPEKLVGRRNRLEDVSDRLASMTDYQTDGVELVTF